MANVIFGGTRIGNRDAFIDENLTRTLDILAAHSVTTIDTAQAYGNSETTLGDARAGARFTIDTKWSPPSYGECPPWATRENITAFAQGSLRKLGVKVNIFYLHRPDPKTPISETLGAVNEVHKCGLFIRFGLSGCSAAHVEEVYNHCAEQGYVLPTVYQGSYNPLSRSKETSLLPTLRRLGISFYGYGVSAGGFLCKKPQQAAEMAHHLASASASSGPYLQHEKYAIALAAWNTVAENEGITNAELAYRWAAHHSALAADGNAMVIGASSTMQLDETLAAIGKGALGETARTEVQKIWDKLNLVNE